MLIEVTQHLHPCLLATPINIVNLTSIYMVNLTPIYMVNITPINVVNLTPIYIVNLTTWFSKTSLPLGLPF